MRESAMIDVAVAGFRLSDSVSYGFWATWVAVGLGYELYAVRYERRHGALPLTRVLRDRLMRRSTPVKLGVMLFLAWLWLHFTENVTW